MSKLNYLRIEIRPEEKTDYISLDVIVNTGSRQTVVNKGFHKDAFNSLFDIVWREAKREIDEQNKP